MIPSRPASSLKRIDGVDILRGLAIFFVLMNHVNIRLLIAKVPYTHGIPAQLVSTFVWNGQRGVQIFFAVSGFLITSTTLRRWGSPYKVHIRDFYWLRFARIAPLLLLLLTILSILHFAHFRNYIVTPKTGGLGRALLAALTFHINVLEAHRGYLPGNWDILWSLSVEEMFYLFFPWVFRLFGRSRLLIAVLVTFVVLGPFSRTMFAHGNEIWREYLLFRRHGRDRAGCLTALFISGKQLTRSTLRILGATGAAILIFSLCFSNHAIKWGLGRNGLDMTILAAGTCLVIIAATESKWRSPAVLTPLVKLGQRSYEVYLTHVFVVFAFFNYFVSIGKPMRAVPILFIAVILVSGILGEIVARFYSEPMNQLLRKRAATS